MSSIFLFSIDPGDFVAHRWSLRRFKEDGVGIVLKTNCSLFQWDKKEQHRKGVKILWPNRKRDKRIDIHHIGDIIPIDELFIKIRKNVNHNKKDK